MLWAQSVRIGLAPGLRPAQFPYQMLVDLDGPVDDRTIVVTNPIASDNGATGLPPWRQSANEVPTSIRLNIRDKLHDQVGGHVDCGDRDDNNVAMACPRA